MLSGGEHVLVAVSGDRTPLPCCFVCTSWPPTSNLTLTVGHLNHGIRGQEADADEILSAVKRRSDLPSYPKALMSNTRQRLEKETSRSLP